METDKTASCGQLPTIGMDRRGILATFLPLALLALLANAATAHAFGLGLQGVGVVIAVFIASLTSSIAGFAFSAICGAMLFHLIDAPVRAVQIMLLCSIANQCLMNWSLRDGIVWRSLVPFMLGGLVGLPVGITLLMETTRDIYLAVFGSLLLIYATCKLLNPMFTLRAQHVGWDVLAGFLGGVTGGAAAFPGAFVTIWCSFKGWSKHRQRSLYQPFILLMQVTSIVVIASLHVLDGHARWSGQPFVATDVIYVVAGLLGTACGMACFARLNDKQFALTVNALLLLSGISLIL